MGWSFRIGRVAGIDVFVHFTFVILLAWIGFAYYRANNSVAEAVSGLVFICTLFGIVVLHELGHALAARRFGIATRDITLLPIGGVARLERMPDDPIQELIVAVAGPAVNVVLAAGLFIVLILGHGLAPLDRVMQVGGDVLTKLFWVNVMLVVFNLLPAFPMDGGRVLRALLAMPLGYLRATQIAAGIGQAMALLFALIGLFGIPGYSGFNPFLIFIALFVWVGAAQEASLAQIRSALNGIPVMHAMITDFRTLAPTDPLSQATQHLMQGFQQDFPVVDEEGRVVGVLTLKELASALGEHGPQSPVSSAMRQKFVTVGPRDMLHAAFLKLQEGDCRTLPVVHDGRLLGLMTSDNLAEVLLIQQSLGGTGLMRGGAIAARGAQWPAPQHDFGPQRRAGAS